MRRDRKQDPGGWRAASTMGNFVSVWGQPLRSKHDENKVQFDYS
jgi:hypothetical protein